MKLHREWFYEYARYEGGDMLLWEKSTTKIIGWGRSQLILPYGRSRTLPGVLHNLGLERNLITTPSLISSFTFSLREEIAPPY
jgi:hypothetical protein